MSYKLLLPFQSQGSERPYANENPDRSEGNFGWSEQQPERQWVSFVRF